MKITIKSCVNFFALFLFRVFESRPKLMRFIKSALKKNPYIWEKLKLIMYGQGRGEDFLTFDMGRNAIYFAKGPLSDTRGIGRVSKEMHESLKKKAVSYYDHEVFLDKKFVHFYSSIHWCPEVLPENSVVMVHDVTPMLFPEVFTEASKTWSKRYKDIAHQAKLIITISHSSAEDISKHLDIPEDRIKVVYNGVTQLPVAADPYVKIPEKPYAVFFGSEDKHKNVDIIFRAFCDRRLDDIDLVMIGDNDQCKNRVSELGIKDKVYFLGRLDDAEAGFVIKNALVMLFPSLYEGFGLPPLEAALLGTPAITSRRPAMTEILADSGVFCDPYSEEEWINSVLSFMDDHEYARNVTLKIMKTSSSLPWDRSADTIVNVIGEWCDELS